MEIVNFFGSLKMAPLNRANKKHYLNLAGGPNSLVDAKHENALRLSHKFRVVEGVLFFP